MALVARAATEAGGGGPASLARLEVQFRGMGRPEQEITVTGTVARGGAASTPRCGSRRDRTDNAIVREGVARLRR